MTESPGRAAGARLSTWTTYRTSIGDRTGLFRELVRAWPIDDALYPGSYVDLSPSVVIGSVTYVDSDRRAAQYFGRPDVVRQELAASSADSADHHVEFVGADYTDPLPLADRRFDLLISLFAGPVWENCRRYLSPRGLLLANTSHGDASLAALDPELELVAAVHHRDGRYRLDVQDLESYLVAKKPAAADAELIRATGRGIAYTRSAFAYLFCRREATSAR